MLTVGSLFSGIGGIDLGLERAGMRVVWQVEIEPWCRRVLAKHWPTVRCYEDVRAVHAHTACPTGGGACDGCLRPVDVLAGGFPCQPVSLAGKRLGQDDERWLWPEFARLIRELRPRYALMENVPGLLVRGMGDVLADLAACGYDAEWDCIPAAAVGAPHIRDRVWIVGTRNGPDAERGGVRDAKRGSSDRATSRVQGAEPERERIWPDAEPVGGDVADAERVRRTRGPQRARRSRQGDRGRPTEPAVTEAAEWDESCGVPANGGGARGTPPLADPEGQCGELRTTSRERPRRLAGGSPPTDIPDPEGTGRPFGTQPRIFASVTGPERRRGERIPEPGWDDHWAVEPDVGRVAHGVPARVDRLRGLGNAVVPQIVEWVGRRIVAADKARREGASS